MSHNTLIEKIRTDAARTVEDSKAKSAEAIAAISSETEAKIEELTTIHTTNLQKSKKQLELIAISKAKQAGKNAVQKAKREHIDAVFAAVQKELIEQSSADYVAFFTTHLEATVPKDVHITSVSAPQNRVTETTEILQAAGLSAEVNPVPDLSAGLMIQAVDGVYDLTLARIFAEKKPELEAMVVNHVMS
jgi:vacuolar-type H+-ATPase subunit E/Vma4